MGTKLEKALAEIRKCLELGFKMTPPIKGVGLQLISFASNKPDLFNTLIKNNKALSTLDNFESYLNIQGKLEALAAKEFDLSRNEATRLCSFLWIFELGLATIVANISITNNAIAPPTSIIFNFPEYDYPRITFSFLKGGTSRRYG